MILLQHGGAHAPGGAESVKRFFSKVLLMSVVTGLIAFLGCGDDTLTDPGDGGGGTPSNTDIDIFDIFLRPRAIQRVPDAGGLPNPQLAVHYLTAFFEGGVDNPDFTWTLDAALGELVPKAEGLAINEAAVALVNDGNTALGFYDITVTGTSGGKSSTHKRRFAVVENSWQKHSRVTFANPQEPPVSLVSHPIFVPTSTGDELYYVESPSEAAINLARIKAYTSLNGGEQLPTTVFVPPPNEVVPGAQVLVAADKHPDVSPGSMGAGYEEILFSSQMDPDYPQRCPTPTCRERIPFRIWLVQSPSGILEHEAKVLTADSTFAFLGGEAWYAFDFFNPQWDPTSTGYPARIAFLSDLAGDGTDNLWLGDIIDTDGDGKGDELVNNRQLTMFGGVTGFDWHPDGQSLYVTGDPKVIFKVSSTSGLIQKEIGFTSQDSLLATPSAVSVFHRSGEPTLLAFQADSENLTHLYVYNEDEEVLSRVTPYPFPVKTKLFPSWHPEKRWLTYVSDYSVNAWSNALDPTPLTNADFERQPRSRYPSAWVLKLED